MPDAEPQPLAAVEPHKVEPALHPDELEEAMDGRIEPPERGQISQAEISRRASLREPGSKLVVPIVVGTRPEAIKLLPVILAMRKSECYEPLVVSTGQHNRMVDYIFELAGIKPDVALWAGSRRSNLNERVSAVMKRFEDFCADRFELAPDQTPPPRRTR